jgi:hypothetical protein
MSPDTPGQGHPRRPPAQGFQAGDEHPADSPPHRAAARCLFAGFHEIRHIDACPRWTLNAEWFRQLTERPQSVHAIFQLSRDADRIIFPQIEASRGRATANPPLPAYMLRQVDSDAGASAIGAGVIKAPRGLHRGDAETSAQGEAEKDKSNGNLQSR